MEGLVEFLHREQAQSETDPVIIAHGGYLRDFPILLVGCMKDPNRVYVRRQYVSSSG